MIAAPTPILPDLQGFQLLKAGELLASFPATLKPPDIGSAPDLTLDRAPGSAVFFMLGDLIQKPQPFTLTGPMYEWSDWLTAMAGQAEYQRALNSADTLTFGGLPFCTLLPGGWVTASALTTSFHYQLTVTCLPAGPLSAVTILEAINS